ncbi:DUF3278 domain-containing protein [Apilactobacillus timberlakei]|uniref:DUF3278 domain-containing protein n=1 Tax=Apilactobacillus timberlakei TaxID=2008380 RepID=UPI0015E847A1|nr:DUF3278 domain-containing protein [Apilactobacillus timberlakei]
MKNKKKESLFTKYIKMFYGVSGPLDEYKRQEINRIGNNSFIACWWYILTSNLIFLYYGFNDPKHSFIVCACINFVFIMFISIYIIVASRRAKLTTNEVSVFDYKNEKRKALYKGVGLGIYFGFAMYIIMPLSAVFINHESYVGQLIHPDVGFLSFILMGLYFGFCMYIIMRIRIKKMK